MLVLTRKVGQKLVIGDNITIVVSRVSGNRVSVGIEAPPDVHIVRGELKQIRDEFKEGSSLPSDLSAVAPDLGVPLDGAETFPSHTPR